MFGGSVTLFRVLGFPVRVNASWLALALLVTWSLAVGYFPHVLPGRDGPQYLALGVLGMLGLIASLLLHELSHAAVARRLGLRIAGITLFIFGGVAEMLDMPARPRDEALIAAAGPAMSLMLAGLAALLSMPFPDDGVAAVLLSYLAAVNLVLALFNLVPGFPLDGGRLLRAALWARSGNPVRATRAAGRVGEAFGFVLIAGGAALVLFGGAMTGLWWVLIGLFLHGAARQAVERESMRQLFHHLPARRLVTRAPVVVPATLPLDRFVDDYALGYHFSHFPVVEDGRPVGILRTRAVADVPRAEWAVTPVAALMRPLGPEDVVHPDDTAEAALARMQENGEGRVLVVDGGRLEGVLTLRDLLEHLALSRLFDRET